VLGLVCRLRGRPVEDGARALATVGLDTLGDRSIRELSMGQRRRAVLAAAFVGEPTTLLLDEPLEAMDRAMRGWLTAWITDASTRDATVIVATHDVEPFVRLTRRAIVVAGGVPRVLEPLPDERDARMALLDRSARGE
jgi:viologen exporter family transport system ATP-binding protein